NFAHEPAGRRRLAWRRVLFRNRLGSRRGVGGGGSGLPPHAGRSGPSAEKEAAPPLLPPGGGHPPPFSPGTDPAISSPREALVGKQSQSQEANHGRSAMRPFPV